MKKISYEIVRFRIRLLQKILAVIGISAVIYSCGGNSGDAEQVDQDTAVTDVIDPDTVPVKDSVPVSEQQQDPAPPVQNNTPPDMNTPDHPMTKYGVPYDDNDMKARYGVPMPSDIDRI